MKILGIIPSRYQSSRFPGKPLVDIAGKSMIQRVYEQAKKSALLTDVVVATDDQRIFHHVLSFGGKATMTSTDHANGTLRCGEVISKETGYDVVINIQGDEPLVKPEQIDAVLDLFNRPEVEIGTVVKRLHNVADIENENRIKVVLDHAGNALYFSRSAIPFVQGKHLTHWPESISYFKHIGIYAWRTETLKKLLLLPATELEKAESLEQLRWLFYGYKIATVETHIETPNVDTPEDVTAVIRALNENL
ncbi:MAG: 3-deoxy-manno-octulosonate cytidylyltransferase [Bacteroidetes bacterium]|nr:3-deoxy-manno-octulosonate cytidylyltransferase [Bacteroidota bacterium]